MSSTSAWYCGQSVSGLLYMKVLMYVPVNCTPTLHTCIHQVPLSAAAIGTHVHYMYATCTHVYMYMYTCTYTTCIHTYMNYIIGTYLKYTNFQFCYQFASVYFSGMRQSILN